MARLLTQMFENTEVFQMRMRPELLLLQKTMVVVEGVARSLDPRLNIWIAAEPVVRDWLTDELGPRARMRDMAANVNALTTALRQAPQLIERGAKIVDALEAENAEFNKAPRSGGIRWAMVIPLWAGTAALIVIAVKLLLG
jgi:ubiquinone biosynthesis protein